MCIISISKINDDYILFHNRDENIYREFSLPQLNICHKITYYAPLDIESKGTWIYDSKDFFVCVLNGGLEFHAKNPPYVKSRGQVALEILNYPEVKHYFNSSDFTQIEPFNLIIFEKKSHIFYRIIWTGEKKILTQINQFPFLWASTTLYTHEQRNRLKEDFIKKDISSETEIYNWHYQNRMQKNNLYPDIETVCITKFQINSEFLELYKI